MHRQPVKPQPMQQYALLPITKPFVVAQRTFFNLHRGQKDMPYNSIFRRSFDGIIFGFLFNTG
jgi:hypothetical protein